MSDFHELRMKTGLTIEELSDELGYSPRQVYRWDNGETAPRQAVMKTMAILSAADASMTSGVISLH